MAKQLKIHRYITHMILAFIMGSVISATFCVQSTNKLLSEEKFLAQPSLNIINSITLLTQLRKKNMHSAIELTEWQLDQHLIDLSTHITPENKSSIGPLVRNSIAQAKQYRLLYPSKVKAPELKAAIAQVLELSPEQQLAN